MADFSELPELEATPHELIEVFELGFLLIFAYLFENVHELVLFELVLFFIQYFLDMLVLVEKIVVAELTTSDLIID